MFQITVPTPALFEPVFWYSIYVTVISPLVFPPLVHLWQLTKDPYKRWWQNNKAFYPSPLLNILTIFSYILMVAGSKFIARYVIQQPVFYGGKYTLLDLLQLPVYLVVLDVISYFMHKVQHHPWFYRYSHITHHQVKYVGIWASFYANPLDYLTTSLPFSLVGGYLFPSHWITDSLISITSALNLVIIHSDYKEISTGFHSIHHLNPKYNLSGGHPYLDKLFNTLMTPEAYQKMIDENKKKNEE